jgi:hypothetical protein
MGTIGFMAYHFTSFITFFVLLLMNTLVPGAFWSWAFPKDIKSIWQKSIIAIFIGFIFSLCWSFLLNTLCLNSLTVNVLGSLVFAISGYNIGKKRGCFSSKELGNTLFYGLRISILFSIIFLVFNVNSEWLPGGWDPGIYTNQGISTARNNGFDNVQSLSNLNLTTDELFMISKVPNEMSNSNIDGYRELLPGVRLDIQTGETSNLFFRNYPNFISMLIKWGAVDFGFKANVFAGLLFLLVFFVLCYRSFGSFYSLAFCAVLLLHSLFLYHIKLPTTEVLQMTLFFGFVLINSWKTNLFFSVFSGLIFFCTVTNRASFIGFGSIYLFFVCFAKSATTVKMRDNFLFLAFSVTGLVGGLIYDIIYCGNTVVKLSYVFDKLLIVSIVSVFASIVVISCSKFVKIYSEKILLFFENRKNGYIFASILMVVTVVVMLVVYSTSDYLGHQIKMLISYFGFIPLIFAFGGIYFMLFDPKVNLYVKVTVIFLILISVITFANQYVANLYPWAARRYVTYTLPLLILSAIYLPYILWSKNTTVFKVMSVLCLLAICVPQMKTVSKVFMESEYRGVANQLETLNSQIKDKAVILVDDHRFATPLMYVYGHKVIDNKLLVSRVKDAKSAKQYYDLLKKIKESGNTLYFLNTSHGANAPSMPFDISNSNVWNASEFETTEVVHGKDQKTFEYKYLTFEPYLYEVVDIPEYKLKEMSTGYIDIGESFDFFNIKSGLYDSEVSDGNTVRWTSECAELLFPVENINQPVSVNINYTVMHRPIAIKSISYKVNNIEMNDVVGTTNYNMITDSFKIETYVLLQTNIIEMTIDTFVPKSTNGSSDSRKLGVMLESIEVSQ